MRQEVLPHLVWHCLEHQAEGQPHTGPLVMGQGMARERSPLGRRHDAAGDGQHLFFLVGEVPVDRREQ